MKVMNVTMVVMTTGVLLVGSAYAGIGAERSGTKDSNAVRTLPYSPTSKVSYKLMPFDGRTIETQFSRLASDCGRD